MRMRLRGFERVEGGGGGCGWGGGKRGGKGGLDFVI